MGSEMCIRDSKCSADTSNIAFMALRDITQYMKKTLATLIVLMELHYY